MRVNLNEKLALIVRLFFWSLSILKLRSTIHVSRLHQSFTSQKRFRQQNAFNLFLNSHNLSRGFSSLIDKTIAKSLLLETVPIWWRLKLAEVTHRYTVLILARLFKLSLLTHVTLIGRGKDVYTARITHWDALVAAWQKLSVNLSKSG